jgi:hypothetical protein
MKAQRNGSDGRVLLGDNTVGEAVMLQRIRFLCFGLAVSWNVLCLHVQLTVCVCIQLTLAQNLTFASVSGTLLLHKSGSVWTDWEQV